MKLKDNINDTSYSLDNFIVKARKENTKYSWIIFFACIIAGIVFLHLEKNDYYFTIVAFFSAFAMIFALLECYIYYISVEDTIIKKRNIFGKITQYDASLIKKVEYTGTDYYITFQNDKKLHCDGGDENAERLYIYALSFIVDKDDIPLDEICDIVKVKPQRKHIIIGIAIALFSILCIYVSLDEEGILLIDLIGWLVLMFSGGYYALYASKLLLKFDGKTIIHKNTFGQERTLHLCDITSIESDLDFFRLDFSRQYDKHGNEQQFKKPLYFYSGYLNAKIIIQYARRQLVESGKYDKE